ncbi:nucleotidyltransferase family protein [archaeon]|jgi:uncharacterized protein|nr:nucleotidyltransferase family protein [archaeon]
MVFTEIKQRNNNEYFYRVLSLRDKDKIFKKRIYLGKDLTKKKLKKKELEADKKFYEVKRKRKGNEFEKIKKKIVKILKEKGIKKAGIFGSYARGEQRKNSDIDILIKPTTKTSGFAFFGLQDILEKELKTKVDLITYHSINHRIKERILNQEVKII